MKGSGHGKKRGNTTTANPSTSPKRPTKLQKRSLSTKRRSPSSSHNDTQSQLSAFPLLDSRQQRQFTQMLTPVINYSNISTTTTATAIPTPQTQSRATITTQSGPMPQWSKRNVENAPRPSSHSTNPTSAHHIPLAPQSQLHQLTHKRQFVTQRRSNLGQNDHNGQNIPATTLLSTPTHSHLLPRRKFSQTTNGSIQGVDGEGNGAQESLSFAWSPEDEENARQVLSTIPELGQAVKAMRDFIHADQPIELLMQKWGKHVDVSPDFKLDPDSPFSEAVQRNRLYQAFPSSLKKMKKFNQLPEGFDRADFVSENISRFHTEQFPSDQDILHLLNSDQLTPELLSIFQDFNVEEFAQVHGVEFIGASPELKASVKHRLHRNKEASRPPIQPLTALNLLPEQMEALDSLLGFALPKISQDQTDAVLIAHLKKKALDLTMDYNSDPFHAQSIRRKQEFEHAQNSLIAHQAQLDLEVQKYKENLGKNPEEDLQRQELIMKRQVLLDKLQDQINGKKKQQKAKLATVNPETMNTIKKLPTSLNAKNLQEASKVLKESAPLVAAPGVAEQTSRAEATKKRQNVSKKPEWLKKLSAHYQLTKPRISQMVAATALWGYWSVGNPTNWTDLALLTTGTVALSSSASIINQIRETDVDAKMTRTMGRPLVTKAISIDNAKKQAIGYAAVGSALLFPLSTIVPVLGLSNIALYGGLYTSLKRTTPLNTEVGALVGAIPPMMGYFAALGAGQAWDANLTALLYPAAMMISWQIQHVMLICVRRGDEYNRSGLVMQCKDDPELKKTINKGIAWSVISTVVSAIPFFTGHADITQLFATYIWAIYTYPYAMAMKKRDNKKLGQVLLAGYVVLGLTIIFSLNSQVPADAWGYLFTAGPLSPSPLPEQPPSLGDVILRGAGKVGAGAIETLQTLAVDAEIPEDANVVEGVTPSAAAVVGNANPAVMGANGSANVKLASVADDVVPATSGGINMAALSELMSSNKAKLTKFTEMILNMDNTPSSQDDV